MYTVELLDQPERKIVGPVLHTSFVANRQAEEVPPFFHKIMEDGDLETVPDRADANQICAFLKPEDSPEFDYHMGVEVTSFANVPDGMTPLVLPSCRCASITLVKRGNKDVMMAMNYLLKEWLPANGLRPDVSAPPHILYDDRFLPVFREKGYAGNPVAQLFIPVTAIPA